MRGKSIAYRDASKSIYISIHTLYIYIIIIYYILTSSLSREPMVDWQITQQLLFTGSYRDWGRCGISETASVAACHHLNM